MVPSLQNKPATIYFAVHILTYIIGHYNPSVTIIDLASHTTYVVCVNFIHKWRDIQFKFDSPNNRFFEKQFYLLSEFL